MSQQITIFFLLPQKISNNLMLLNLQYRILRFKMKYKISLPHRINFKNINTFLLTRQFLKFLIFINNLHPHLFLLVKKLLFTLFQLLHRTFLYINKRKSTFSHNFNSKIKITLNLIIFDLP